jgi:hypothetical protein
MISRSCALGHDRMEDLTLLFKRRLIVGDDYLPAPTI